MRQGIKGKFSTVMSEYNFHSIHDVYKYIAQKHGLTPQEVKEMHELNEKTIQYYCSNPIESFRGMKWNNIFLLRMKSFNWDRIARAINKGLVAKESKRQLIKIMNILDI